MPGFPSADPFWYGGRGVWPRPCGRYGRPYGPFGGRGGLWGSSYSALPSYQREVELLLRDQRTVEPLDEARARNAGATTGGAAARRAMCGAASIGDESGS